MIQIANYEDARRLSATAGETMAQGEVVYVSDDGSGNRFLMKVGNGDAAKLLAGNYGIVFKVDVRAEAVESTFVGVGQKELGGTTRLTTIVSGDAVVVVGRGAIVQYAPADLDDTLNAAEGGALPAVGDSLGVLGSKFCKADAQSAIVSPYIGRVNLVLGTNVLVELV